MNLTVIQMMTQEVLGQQTRFKQETITVKVATKLLQKVVRVFSHLLEPIGEYRKKHLMNSIEIGECGGGKLAKERRGG